MTPARPPEVEAVINLAVPPAPGAAEAADVVLERLSELRPGTVLRAGDANGS